MNTFISKNIGLRENGYIYKQKRRTLAELKERIIVLRNKSKMSWGLVTNYDVLMPISFNTFNILTHGIYKI